MFSYRTFHDATDVVGHFWGRTLLNNLYLLDGIIVVIRKSFHFTAEKYKFFVEYEAMYQGFITENQTAIDDYMTKHAPLIGNQILTTWYTYNIRKQGVNRTTL